MEIDAFPPYTTIASNPTNRGCRYAALPPKAKHAHWPATRQQPCRFGTQREGNPTTTQVLDRIKNAEAEVEQMLQKARETRDQTIQKARQDALRHLRNAEEKGRETLQQQTQQATEQARQVAARLDEEAQREVDAMEKSFESRLEESKKRILVMFERALDVQD